MSIPGDIQGIPPKKRASLEKLTDDEKLSKRKERLIGRTVKGVLIRNRQNFSVKWNDCQFDNVYVSERCVELSLGPRPERGIVAVVKCEIKTMGPANAPWYLQHPYTDVVELVTRYRRKRRKSSRWMHSGMPHSLTSVQFSRDVSTVNSRRASLIKSPRGSTELDEETLPEGLKVEYSRRGSQLIIDRGRRWEYKPQVRGPQQLPPGWEIRSIRSGGCCYFVPSPPGSKRNSLRGRRNRRSTRGRERARAPQRKSGRRSTQKKPSKRPSQADKEAAIALIKEIERQERESRRRSQSRSAKKKNQQQKEKQAPKKKRSGKKKSRGKNRKSKLRRDTDVKSGVSSVEA